MFVARAGSAGFVAGAVGIVLWWLGRGRAVAGLVRAGGES